MANLMANDSGAAAPEQHMALLLGMLGGQILTAAAGVPGGLAFFWRGRRRALAGWFAILFVIGAFAQAWAFHAFFAAHS